MRSKLQLRNVARQLALGRLCRYTRLQISAVINCITFTSKIQDMAEKARKGFHYIDRSGGH